MSIEPFVSNYPFYDAKNFPHGFSRSGEFTRTEAEILQDCGRTIEALNSRIMAPTSPAHEAMLRVIAGEQQPSSLIEKVWMKYLDAIRQKKPFLSCAMRPLRGVTSKQQGYRELAFD